MSVASGPVGRERVHFEAPAPQRVPGLMGEFISLFNSAPESDLVVKAALAHLRFLTVHPFGDGNGRMSRALTEVLLCRSDASPRRFYGMARYIEKNRESYYEAIEKAQRGDADVARWLEWFLSAVKSSIAGSEAGPEAVFARSAFWASVDSVPLNERQRRVLAMLSGSFEGKLAAREWAKVCKVSPDTALRVINDLIRKGVPSAPQQAGEAPPTRCAEQENDWLVSLGWRAEGVGWYGV